MKKLSFWVLSLLAVTMLTACINDDDDPVSKVTDYLTVNSRAINGDDVVFSQNTATVTINSTDMTIAISCGYRDAVGASQTLTTPAMPLTFVGGSIYSFSSASTTSGVTNLSGYFDVATVTLWYSFLANGTDQVFSSTQLIYSYSTTTVTNPDNGNHTSYTNSQYMFVLDSKCEKCTMVITNFAPNLSGAIQDNQMYWEGLTVTPTATGYVITTDKAESNLMGTNAITDLTVNLDNQGRTINGNFKCNDFNINVTGDLFPTTSY